MLSFQLLVKEVLKRGAAAHVVGNQSVSGSSAAGNWSLRRSLCNSTIRRNRLGVEWKRD
jgi:hypothetical protein